MIDLARHRGWNTDEIRNRIEQANASLFVRRAIAEAGRAHQLVVFEEGGHNDLYSFEERYRSALHGFLSATIGGGAAQ